MIIELPTGAHVALVDDVLNSGRTFVGGHQTYGISPAAIKHHRFSGSQS